MLLTGEIQGLINFLTLFCNYVFLLHCCCLVDNIKHVFCFTLSRNILKYGYLLLFCVLC
jgi:hypothetical protein